MNIKTKLRWIFICILIFSSGFSAGAMDNVRRRFALITSNNRGIDKPTLYFADDDGRTMADIFLEMGGVDKKDMVQLPGADIKKIDKGFRYLQRLIEETRKKSGMQTEILFYYSGHADSNGLLLGDEKYSYKQLKQNIQKLKCNMTFVILDCCSSASIITAKGGTLTPPFLVDASSEYQGYTYLTSSREREESYESATIAGSLFTYALASGFRGAADLDSDGSITLNEIFSYTDQETRRLVIRENIVNQKPVFASGLKQSGKIVMTDINKTNARLVIEKKIEGDIMICERRGNRSWEFRKLTGTCRQIGLPAGMYTITIPREAYRYICQVEFRKGRTVTLSSYSDMRRIKNPVQPAKGGGGYSQSFSLRGGPLLPLGDTRKIIGTGFAPAVAWYFLYPGQNQDIGLGIETGFAYEEYLGDDNAYNRYSVPLIVSLKWSWATSIHWWEFFMEPALGFSVMYQDHESPDSNEKLYSRITGSLAAGTSIVLNSKLKLGLYYKLTIIPYDKTYIYTVGNPGLVVDFLYSGKEK